MSDANDPVAVKVKTRQIEMLYRNMPLSIVSTAAVAAMIGIILWPVLPQDVLFGWFLAMMAVAFLRGYDAFSFRRNRSRLTLDVWEKRFLAGTAASGIIWGAAAIFLFPADAIGYQYFIAVVIVGVASSAIAIYPVHFPALSIFFLSTLSPLLVCLLLSGDRAQTGLGLMAVLFTVYVFMHARDTNRSLLAAFRLQNNNLDLIEELREQKNAVEQASREKSRFIAAANHDIRQPLHALNLLVSALEGEAQQDKQQYIRKSIHRCVECVRILFDGLMDVSRLDGGDVVPVKQHFRIQNKLPELRTIFKPLADEKGIHLEIENSPLVLHTDSHLLQRILKNLISNAIKYTGRGGSVWVNITEDDGCARIIVADNGVGIPKEFHEQVYQEFFQINNAAVDYKKGLGLGLAIVKRLAFLIGCPVSLESEHGKGTRFSVQVPLGSAQQMESEAAASASANSPVEGISVLVIDDDLDSRNAMILLLENWGCNVVAEDSVSAARQALGECDQVPDIIVVDYHLTCGMSGHEAVDAIQQYLGTEVPAILMTGDTVVDRRRKANATNHLILHKPIMPAQLSLAITHCHRHRDHAGPETPRRKPAFERRRSRVSRSEPAESEHRSI